MSTPASFPQVAKLYDVLGEPSTEKMQYLLANGDLFKAVADAAGSDLAKVDRDAFRALLRPAAKFIDWAPVDQYADKLRDWNHRFPLGLSDEQIDGLAAKLPDHAGPHQPTGISFTSGKGLPHDWKVVMQVLKYEVEKLGVPFTEYFDASRLSYFSGSEPPKSKKPTLDVALLDIGTFWDPQNGVVPREVRTQRSCWPGLEVAWLLALNPQVFLAMDGETVPYMWAPGLVVGSDRLPCFGRGSDEAFVSGIWDDDRWRSRSVVAFREC